jgi:hypothetical protein
LQFSPDWREKLPIFIGILEGKQEKGLLKMRKPFASNYFLKFSINDTTEA